MEVTKNLRHEKGPTLITVEGFYFWWYLAIWSQLGDIGVTIVVDDCVIKVKGQKDFFMLAFISNLVSKKSLYNE